MFFFLRLSYIFFKNAAPLCFFKPKRENLTFCFVDKKSFRSFLFSIDYPNKLYYTVLVKSGKNRHFTLK